MVVVFRQAPAILGDIFLLSENSPADLNDIDYWNWYLQQYFWDLEYEVAGIGDALARELEQLLRDEEEDIRTFIPSEVDVADSDDERQRERREESDMRIIIVLGTRLFC